MLLLQNAYRQHIKHHHYEESLFDGSTKCILLYTCAYLAIYLGISYLVPVHILPCTPCIFYFIQCILYPWFKVYAYTVLSGV